MKRIQLFEFEDLAWFPASIRVSMTRMITVVHRWLGTSGHVASMLNDLIRQTGCDRIVDYCSGDGGPMPEVMERLHEKTGATDLTLTLTDLYPNQAAAKRINESGSGRISYATEPVDVTKAGAVDGPCLRTMICSFHHMPPGVARKILAQAQSAGDPILIYEISDNRVPPKYLWWIGLPLNFVFGMVVAACTRPMTGFHFCFSFVIPVIPLCFAWDGAVSNARTYTLEDLDELLSGIESNDYAWRTEVVKAKPANHLCLIGAPSLPNAH